MENLTNWCVYMHENRVNGKRYIGITSQKPTRRWANGNGYKHCPLFYHAIQKYGWDAFKHEILFTELTQEQAERLEMDLIEKYETQNPEKGYNLAEGGETNKGFHRTEEFKQKLSATKKGHCSGANNNRYGTHHTEETKVLIRDSQKGRTKAETTKKRMSESAKKRWGENNQAERQYLREINIGGKSARARAVICIETGKRYESMTEAERDIGVDVAGIVKCCKGLRDIAGGYHWVYAEEAIGK